MARLPTVDIPSADSLRPIDFTGEKKILRPDVSKIGSGAVYGGRQLQQLGEQVARREEEEADYELSSATVDLMTASNQIVDEDDKNPEYAGSSARVTEAYKKKTDEISKNLSPKQKRLFELRSKEVEANTLRKTSANAFKKEVETERARISNQLNELRENAYKDKENMQVYANTAVELLNNSVKKGYYSSDDVQRIGEAWKSDTFTKIINTMKPEDARAALDSPLATLIPDTERDRLKLEADDKIGDNEAGSYVAANFNGSMTRLMKKMTDDKLSDSMRSKVMQQANLVVAAAESDREQSNRAAYSGIYRKLEEGGDIAEVMKSREWNLLEPSQKENLKKERSAVRPDVTPYQTQKRLTQAMAEYGKGNPQPLEYLLSVKGAELSKADAEYATGVLSGQKSMRDDVSTTQLVTNRFPGNEKSAARAFSAITRMETEQGKPMTNQEKIRVIDDIVLLNLQGKEPDHIQLSGAMYAGWKGWGNQQRKDTAVKFENLSSQIGKDFVRENDSVTNAKALGRVLEWKDTQLSSGKKVLDEDVQKRYQAEVSMVDYEEQMELTGYAKVNDLFEKFDAVVDKDFEPDDRVKIYNELKDAHMIAVRNLLLDGGDLKNNAAYSRHLDAALSKAKTMKKYSSGTK